MKKNWDNTPMGLFNGIKGGILTFQFTSVMVTDF